MSEEPNEQPLVDYIAIETRSYEADCHCEDNCKINVESGLVLRITIEQANNLNSYFRRKNQKIRLVRVIPPLSIDVQKLVAEEEAFRKATLERVTKRAKETEEKAKERKLKKLAKLKAELGVS